MTLDHIAIWTDNLESLKNYYVTYFNGVPNEKYSNAKNGFQSYFISFNSRTKLEIMSMSGIPGNRNDTVIRQHKGLIHLAFGVDTKQEVDEKAKQLKANGFRILSIPRETGDGYYEFVTLDPDDNRLEVTTKIAE